LPDSSTTSWINLAGYRAPSYQGRGPIVRVFWYVVSALLFETCLLPFGRLKPPLLRLFGAKLGRGVVIKPGVKIKFPWRLTTGDHVWIGEKVWIDNLAEVTLGSHVCLSQGAYLCTGSHDHRSRGFDLVTRPITVGDGAWIAARAILLPGCKVGANTIVGAGSVASGDIPPEVLAAGNPATIVRPRDPMAPPPRSEETTSR